MTERPWSAPLKVIFTLSFTLTGGLLSTVFVRPLPILIWNVSTSAPLGLYRVTRGRPVEVGTMVAAWMPRAYRRLAATRHYVALNVPLVKRVAAIEHDTVCAFGREVSINGRWVAHRMRKDRKDRAMPLWTGCRVLAGSELFLLTADNPKSFDGRYFGVTRQADLIGTAILLWRR